MTRFVNSQVAVLTMTLALVSACRGSRPIDLGVRDGQLTSCPPKPNCVASDAGDTEHKVAPLPLHGSPSQSLQEIKKVVLAMPRTALVEERPDYLSFTFESLIFRFVDDVEFYAPDQAKDVKVRSASRLGYSDLGVNRQRVENIRREYGSSASSAIAP